MNASAFTKTNKRRNQMTKRFRRVRWWWALCYYPLVFCCDDKFNDNVAIWWMQNLCCVHIQMGVIHNIIFQTVGSWNSVCFAFVFRTNVYYIQIDSSILSFLLFTYSMNSQYNWAWYRWINILIFLFAIWMQYFSGESPSIYSVAQYVNSWNSFYSYFLCREFVIKLWFNGRIPWSKLIFSTKV